MIAEIESIEFRIVAMPDAALTRSRSLRPGENGLPRVGSRGSVRTGSRRAREGSEVEQPRDAAILRNHGRTAATGLHLRQGLAFDDWLRMGRQISRIASASAWWLGDWLVYGERAYGQRYKAALEATTLEYQTLRNYASVARRIDMSRRRDTLSFQHHAEVAALPEADQDVWLQRAERFRWTRNELRRQLAATRRRHTDADPDSAVVVRMLLPPDREQRWREAARVAELNLVEWIASAADQAAHEVLGEASAGVNPVRAACLAGGPRHGAGAAPPAK